MLQLLKMVPTILSLTLVLLGYNMFKNSFQIV